MTNTSRGSGMRLTRREWLAYGVYAVAAIGIVFGGLALAGV